ncbi:MAG: DEAD/DEAH box helicase [Saprospiraceae bacterium]|nr:DEAD/DEAH box helicase [Saprospiraceae bacterium]
MSKRELGIIDPIKKALRQAGYTKPTPIQQQAIPILLRGKDLLGCAQTGTGKTAAFAIPILQHLYLARHQGPRKIRALIVTPTRELAIQIDDSFTKYGKHTDVRNTVIFGGVKQGAQTNRLRKGVDVLVATPGRLLDLMGQGFVSLENIEYFVLDEADRMLDMGFIHDIKRIIAELPKQRQSLFFSATMPPEIVKLSRKILGDFESVTIKPEQPTAERVDQVLYFVSKQNKIKLLIHLLKNEKIESALVFSRTKHGANKIVRLLVKNGVNAEAIHGNKSQGARQRALGSFKDGGTRVLVATDIAARGIDIKELSHVINYDLPNIAETYVHRIGRTGRAEASGIAISFCNMEERAYLKDIQALIKQQIPIIAGHPFEDDQAPQTKATRESTRQNQPRPARRKSQRRRSKRNDDRKPKESSAQGREPRRESDQKGGDGQRKRRRGNDIASTSRSIWPLG